MPGRPAEGAVRPDGDAGGAADVSTAQPALTNALTDEAKALPGGARPSPAPARRASSGASGGHRRVRAVRGARAAPPRHGRLALGPRPRGSAGTGPASGPARSVAARAAGASSRPITPEQITADQAAVTAAAAQVEVAQQDLAEATIRSPIAGTVAAAASSPATRSGPTPPPRPSRSSAPAPTLYRRGGRHQDPVDQGRPDRERPPTASAPACSRRTSPRSARRRPTGGTAYPVTLAFTGTPPGVRDGIGAAVTITTARAE